MGNMLFAYYTPNGFDNELEVLADDEAFSAWFEENSHRGRFEVLTVIEGTELEFATRDKIVTCEIKR